jgi:hypothetical protein
MDVCVCAVLCQRRKEKIKKMEGGRRIRKEKHERACAGKYVRMGRCIYLYIRWATTTRHYSLYLFIHRERGMKRAKKERRRNVGEKRVIGQEGGDEKSQECHIV